MKKDQPRIIKAKWLKKEIIEAETDIEEILRVGVNEFGASLKRPEIDQIM